MSFLSRRIPYDRKRMLHRAAILAETWRWRRALVLYRQILAAEPHNAEIHGRARRFLPARGGVLKPGSPSRSPFVLYERPSDGDSARSLEQQAVRSLPKNLEAYRALARSELARGRTRESLRVLFEGSRRLVRAGNRGGAILLLKGSARDRSLETRGRLGALSFAHARSSACGGALPARPSRRPRRDRGPSDGSSPRMANRAECAAFVALDAGRPGCPSWPYGQGPA